MLEEVRSELSAQLGVNNSNFPNILPPTINIPLGDQTTNGIMEITASSQNTMPPEEEGHPPQQPNSTSSTAMVSAIIASNRDDSMSENQ